MFLCDERYAQNSFANELPAWIKDNQETIDKFGVLIPKIFNFFKNKTPPSSLSQLISEDQNSTGIQPPPDLSQMFLTQREVRRPNPTDNSPAAIPGEEKGILTKAMIQSLKRVKYNSQGPHRGVENTNSNTNLSFSELPITEEPFRPNPMEEEYSRFKHEDSTNTTSLFELFSNNNPRGGAQFRSTASPLPQNSSTKYSFYMKNFEM